MRRETVCWQHHANFRPLPAIAFNKGFTYNFYVTGGKEKSGKIKRSEKKSSAAASKKWFRWEVRQKNGQRRRPTPLI